MPGRWAAKHYYPIVLTLFGERSWTTMMRFIIQYPAVKTLNGLSYEEFKTPCIKFIITKREDRPDVWEDQNWGALSKWLFDEVYSASTMALAKSLLVLLDEIKKLTDKMTEIVDNHSLGKIFQEFACEWEIMSAKLLSVMETTSRYMKAARRFNPCRTGTRD